jgi:hypothetical protein
LPFIAPSKPEEQSEFPDTIKNEAHREINDWIQQHMQHSFLTKADEDYFMAKYGIPRRQVKTAFNNRRQRIVTPIRSVMQKELQQCFLSQLAVLGVAMSFP